MSEAADTAHQTTEEPWQ